MFLPRTFISYAMLPIDGAIETWTWRAASASCTTSTPSTTAAAGGVVRGLGHKREEQGERGRLH